uniref:Uncharacterized protein n=1 Tax=Chromera velia CCMP2878 TaxID=1169474 RepID=A0A0G4HU12_9ALVE|eukprot:Cvel_31620.t1-p1 / transcript=Cvel_31620.t1 / gene=Cvel_31620 / organism=Chromera_velia_CCMP2878 / gene_product=hypothetical protein / transcript_product=hypothetical protein / location=Cvel_scaffold4747:557-6580(+) / protein_length=938 / sequence_SO=supercontig / SO=protein_coding / is_pseudo=false
MWHSYLLFTSWLVLLYDVVCFQFYLKTASRLQEVHRRPPHSPHSRLYAGLGKSKRQKSRQTTDPLEELRQAQAEALADAEDGMQLSSPPPESGDGTAAESSATKAEETAGQTTAVSNKPKETILLPPVPAAWRRRLRGLDPAAVLGDTPKAHWVRSDGTPTVAGWDGSRVLKQADREGPEEEGIPEEKFSPPEKLYYPLYDTVIKQSSHGGGKEKEKPQSASPASPAVGTGGDAQIWGGKSDTTPKGRLPGQRPVAWEEPLRRVAGAGTHSCQVSVQRNSNNTLTVQARFSSDFTQSHWDKWLVDEVVRVNAMRGTEMESELPEEMRGRPMKPAELYSCMNVTVGRVLAAGALLSSTLDQTLKRVASKSKTAIVGMPRFVGDGDAQMLSFRAGDPWQISVEYDVSPLVTFKEDLVGDNLKLQIPKVIRTDTEAFLASMLDNQRRGVRDFSGVAEKGRTAQKGDQVTLNIQAFALVGDGEGEKGEALSEEEEDVPVVLDEWAFPGMVDELVGKRVGHSGGFVSVIPSEAPDIDLEGIDLNDEEAVKAAAAKMSPNPDSLTKVYLTYRLTGINVEQNGETEDELALRATDGRMNAKQLRKRLEDEADFFAEDERREMRRQAIIEKLLNVTDVSLEGHPQEAIADRLWNDYVTMLRIEKLKRDGKETETEEEEDEGAARGLRKTKETRMREQSAENVFGISEEELGDRWRRFYVNRLKDTIRNVKKQLAVRAFLADHPEIEVPKAEDTIRKAQEEIKDEVFQKSLAAFDPTNEKQMAQLQIDHEELAVVDFLESRVQWEEVEGLLPPSLAAASSLKGSGGKGETESAGVPHPHDHLDAEAGEKLRQQVREDLRRAQQFKSHLQREVDVRNLPNKTLRQTTMKEIEDAQQKNDVLLDPDFEGMGDDQFADELVKELEREQSRQAEAEEEAWRLLAELNKSAS